MKRLILLLAVTLVGASLAPAQDNLLTNGNFTELSGGWPSGWKEPEGWRKTKYGQNWSVTEAESGSAIVLQNPSDAENLATKTQFPVGELTGKIEIGMKARVTEAGAEAKTPWLICFVAFLRADGSLIRYGAAPEVNSKGEDWQEVQVVETIPGDAATIDLSVTANKGVENAEVADVSIISLN